MFVKQLAELEKQGAEIEYGDSLYNSEVVTIISVKTLPAWQPVKAERRTCRKSAFF